VEQASALSVEQALAFRTEQLRAMSPAMLDFITALTNFTQPRDSGTEGPTADPGSVTKAPDDVVTGRDGNVVTAVRPGVTANSGKQDATDSSDSTATRRTDDVEQTRAPPDDDDDSSNWRPPPPPPNDGWTSNYDPFQFQSQIDAMLDTVPDRITPQNVEQFLEVLPHIPAADFASRIAPSAVSALLKSSGIVVIVVNKVAQCVNSNKSLQDCQATKRCQWSNC